MNRASFQQDNERVQVLAPGDEIQHSNADAPEARTSYSRRTRWLRMRIEEDGEKVLNITVPWFLCGWLLTLASWALRFVPKEANESVEEQVPGGMKAIRSFLAAVRSMPAGARIEVSSDDTDYVLIECR